MGLGLPLPRPHECRVRRHVRTINAQTERSPVDPAHPSHCARTCLGSGLGSGSGGNIPLSLSLSLSDGGMRLSDPCVAQLLPVAGNFSRCRRTRFIGVLVSSEPCTHVNARLLPRRWFLQLHWVPGRAHTDAQCINICTKTNSTQIHGDGNDGNVSGFGDGREPPPECPPELP